MIVGSGDYSHFGIHRDAAGVSACALLRCCCCLYTNRKFVAAVCACCVHMRDAVTTVGAPTVVPPRTLAALHPPHSFPLSLHLSLWLHLVRVTLLAALFACSPKMRVPVIMCALVALVVCAESECVCARVCVRVCEV